MKIFLDTADVAEIREYAASGLVDGVTTNPSLAAKTGKDYVESLKEICAIVPGAVSGEVLATDEVARECGGNKIAFEPIGAVELKGFVRPVALHRASAQA